MKTNLIIGTRQSLLAMWQSNYIAGRLREEYPGCEVTLKKIVTKGDRILDVPLAKNRRQRPVYQRNRTGTFGRHH